MPIIYVNFADYTLERVYIKQKLLELSRKELKGKIIIEEKELKFEEYLTNIKKYLFILSFSGNGIDGYRQMESIYCGSFPILPSILNNIYAPYCIPYKNEASFLDELLDILHINYRPIDMFEDISLYDKFKLSYWKQRIEEKRNLLLNHTSK